MKKLFLALISLLCTPALALAAISSLTTNLDTCFSIASGTICALTTTATVEVNNIIVVRTGHDNIGTADGLSTEVSITDSAGNTYNRICEYRHGEGGVADGAVAGIFVARATSQLTSGGTITATFSSAVVSKVVHAQEWGVTAGNTLLLAGTCQTEAINSVTDAGPLTITGLTDGTQYLFIRSIVLERSSVAVTANTSGYTTLTPSGADTGTNATSIYMVGERVIKTLSGTTSEANDPTITTVTQDGASIFVALQECPPTGCVAGRRPPIIVQ